MLLSSVCVTLSPQKRRDRPQLAALQPEPRVFLCNKGTVLASNFPGWIVRTHLRKKKKKKNKTIKMPCKL